MLVLLKMNSGSLNIIFIHGGDGGSGRGGDGGGGGDGVERVEPKVFKLGCR